MNDYQRGLLRAAQILAQMAESCGGAERCAYLDAVAAIRAEAEKNADGQAEVLNGKDTSADTAAKPAPSAPDEALIEEVASNYDSMSVRAFVKNSIREYLRRKGK